VNLIGVWREGFQRPLWVMTNLSPEDGLRIYQARMKIEESFKDLKSLLGLKKVMNKSQDNMEKMVALLLIAYAIGLLVGEALRDFTYGTPEQPPSTSHSCTSVTSVTLRKGKRWKLYSGLFVLLKQKLLLEQELLSLAIQNVLQAFAFLVSCHVRTHV
jgi:hypothetical protein